MQPLLSLVLTYYRQPRMLAEHMRQWAHYPQGFRDITELIVIDDGSPEPAVDVIGRITWPDAIRPRVFRILENIPWNYLGARNLGATVACGQWMLRLDLDHVLPFQSANALIDVLPNLDPARWYKLRRFRRGIADATRNKDSIPRDAEYGEIKPHVDTFLCTPALFCASGGYDEDYCGSLGGSIDLARHLTVDHGPAELCDPSVFLECYTRHAIADANVSTLSRDLADYTQTRARKRAEGWPRAQRPLRFPWEQVL